MRITTMQQQPAQPTEPAGVKFLPMEELDNARYEAVAKVYARHKGGLFMGKGEDDLQNTIRIAAANIGADAVIGFKTSKQDDNSMKSGNSRWGSGIAARRSDSVSAEPIRSGFLVALCGDRSLTLENWRRTNRALEAERAQAPTRRGGPSTRAQVAQDTTYDAFVKDSLDNEANWMYLLSAAEYQLEKRGYYTLITPASQLDISGDSIGMYDDETFDRLFGSHTGHVLHIDLVRSSAYNAGFAAGASAEVKAVLYSKMSNSVVWENSASKSLFPTLGLLNALFEGASTRQQKVVSKAAKKLFENLREIN